MSTITIGVDIGQRRDPTAIAVVEGEDRPGPTQRPVWHHVARHLERLPLGTSYPDVAARVSAVVASVTARAGATPAVYLDATGVGTPVVDVLRQAGIAGRLIPVYFTYGDRRTVNADGAVSLGKAWLVSRLQALLQGGWLHLPQTAEATALHRELLDYEIKVDQDANERYGAFRVGSHDDLVTALGLATQVDRRDIPLQVTVLNRPAEHRPAWTPEAAWKAQRVARR
jgi:hypothetical protein